MTIQEAYNKITSSKELKKKAIEALKNGKVEEFLKEQGIDLTVDQIKDAIKAKKSGELSKEELNMAAGGGCDDLGDPCEYLYSFATIGIGCLISYGKNNEVNNNKFYEC